MGFNWKEFYDVGNHLESYSSEEAYQCSAVGRYYYSCYHIVKNYFEDTHFSLGYQNHPHKILIKCLQNGNDEECDLAEALSKLRMYRNKADYYQGFRYNVIRNAKKTTKDIYSLLDNLTNSL